MTHQLLIIEDEEKIAHILKDYLENAGYQTNCLYDGSRAIAHIKRDNPDLILLDIMLPGMDGIEICREVRKFSQVPIIMVTAKVEEIDRLVGLELGADDYICKPFSPREVVARVKSVLRRVTAVQAPDQLTLGDIQMNMETRQVTIHQRELTLTPSEFGLLKVLMAQPNRVFSRNELLNQVQGYDFDGYDRTVDTHIKNLRKKLKQALPTENVITAVYGTGYKFSYPSS